MKIAVVTGASSGLGEQFALNIDKTRKDLDEIWLIARREDRLRDLSLRLSKPARIFPMDITDTQMLKSYTAALEEFGVQVELLINNAGFGKLKPFDELTAEKNCGMVRLNCEALVNTTSKTLPFMGAGGEIINVCSIASFAPTARMAVYSSTKAFVLSFSRALREELKVRKINVLAACPGPMDTEFLPIAGIAKGTSQAFDTLPKVSPEVMAQKALKASRKGRAVYTNRVIYKLYRLVAKLLPHSLVMKMAKT